MIIKNKTPYEEGFDVMYNRRDDKNPYPSLSPEYFEWYDGFMAGGAKRMQDAEDRMKAIKEENA